MKRTALMMLMVGGLIAGTAQAEHEDEYAQGRVLAATPIYETVQVPTSREVCWDEEVRYRRGRSAAPALIGGVIGGAVGRQFGGGNGKDALTALGAIVGASVANDASRRRHRDGYTRVETRCRIADEYYEERRLTGYHVRYEYDGREYSTRTSRDPGRFIDLRVSVAPVGD